MTPYFAYASNMSAALMEQRCPGCRFVGVAYVDDYRLVFRGRSDLWGGAMADLAPQAGSRVWGCLWDLADEMGQALDRQEGVPQTYQRVSIRTVQHDGECVDAWTYRRSDGAQEGAPSQEYAELIVKAADDLDLPGAYAKALRGWIQEADEAGKEAGRRP